MAWSPNCSTRPATRWWKGPNCSSWWRSENRAIMKISFCCTGTEPAPWLAGLRAALPQAQIELWQPGAAPADYAVVWAPPQQFFDQQPQLKGVFAIGAGVDALLKLRLPAHATVVQLDDAGMAVQMAEYVCHAVIRHFRELDVYAADISHGQWTFHKPRNRADFPVGVMGLGVLGQRVAQALTQFEFPVNGWSRSPKVIQGVRGFNGSAHLVDDDLLALLDTGHLAGAMLDVFRTEPLPPEHPFWQQPKITITPHTAARTMRDQSIAQIAGKIEAMERGEPIAGIVDPVRGY